MHTFLKWCNECIHLRVNSHDDDHIVCFLNMIRKWTNFLYAGQMSSIVEGYRNIWLRRSSWSRQFWDVSAIMLCMVYDQICLPPHALEETHSDASQHPLGQQIKNLPEMAETRHQSKFVFLQWLQKPGTSACMNWFDHELMSVLFQVPLSAAEKSGPFPHDVTWHKQFVHHLACIL